MFSPRPSAAMRNYPSLHRLPAVSALCAVLLTLTACQTTGNNDVTGSVVAASRSEQDGRREIEIWGARYKQNQKDAEAAIRYAAALRATGQATQAVAVLEQAAIHHPKNKVVLGDYGRALAETGNLQQAHDVLSRAHSPDQPDWRILSAQGAVLDQMGRHEEAQRHYASALKIAPDAPSVLSNLGLSYALSKNLGKAEETLRRAAARPDAEPRVRQNLALVVDLREHSPEAGASADLASR
jgi:Flp pilus assembly protein TadD